MFHAREDYNVRIQDREKKIPHNEPVFLLRAQDVSAPATLEFWATENDKNKGDPALSALARHHAQRMRDWATTHPTKPADL